MESSLTLTLTLTLIIIIRNIVTGEHDMKTLACTRDYTKRRMYKPVGMIHM